VKDKDLEQATQLLRDAGYVVKKRSTSYTRHTFEVEKDVLKEFFATQAALGMRIKDAVNVALREWIEKHKK
jgi:hypothetical protein